MARSNQSTSRGLRPGTQMLITVNFLVFLIALSANLPTGLCGVRVLRQTNITDGLDMSMDTSTIPSTNLTSVDMDVTTKAMSNTAKPSTPGVSVESSAPTTLDTAISTLPSTSTNTSAVSSSATEPTLTSPMVPKTNETQSMNSTEAPTTAAPSQAPTTLPSETAANTSSITTTAAPSGSMAPTTATNASTDTSEESTTRPKPDPNVEGAGSTFSYNILFLIVSFAFVSF